MKKIRFIPLLLFLFCSLFAHAQTAATNATVDMADTMRSNGKIYVVVGVLVIILIGLLAYLVSIDRKVGKVEKSIEEQNKK